MIKLSAGLFAGYVHLYSSDYARFSGGHSMSRLTDEEQWVQSKLRSAEREATELKLKLEREFIPAPAPWYKRLWHALMTK
jgi:hypothetical protein